MTPKEKQELLRDFCNSVRDAMLERAAKWPEHWDGHELRELCAYAFERERTLRGVPMPGRPRDRAKERRARTARDTIISRDLY